MVTLAATSKVNTKSQASSFVSAPSTGQAPGARFSRECPTDGRSPAAARVATRAETADAAHAAEAGGR